MLSVYRLPLNESAMCSAKSKNAAPLTRRRVDRSCLLNPLVPTANLTVTSFEQVGVPASHT
jgi:hypothetical protein